MKAVDEDSIKDGFVTMWNKLQNSYKELLYPIVETLERTKISCETIRIWPARAASVSTKTCGTKVFKYTRKHL